MILARLLAAAPPPNTGAKRLDKVSANEAPDRILTKVIPTWIVDKSYWGLAIP